MKRYTTSLKKELSYLQQHEEQQQQQQHEDSSCATDVPDAGKGHSKSQFVGTGSEEAGKQAPKLDCLPSSQPSADLLKACHGAAPPGDSSESDSSNGRSGDVHVAAADGGSAATSHSHASSLPSNNRSGSRFDVLMNSRAHRLVNREEGRAINRRQQCHHQHSLHHCCSTPSSSSPPSSPPTLLPPGTEHHDCGDTTYEGVVGDEDLPRKANLRSKAPYHRRLPQPFSHILVLDFEATCDSGSPHFPHEIIEFPVLVLDTYSLQIVAKFHRYVRPTKHPSLTTFCTELTGITQAMVDAADPIETVIKEFREWLHTDLYPLCRAWRQHWQAVEAEASEASPDCHTVETSGCCCPATKSLYPGASHEKLTADGLSKSLASETKKFICGSCSCGSCESEEAMVCFATDGPWDMRKFMYECEMLQHGHTFPPLFFRFVNVRTAFTHALKGKPLKLTHMLSKLGMSFEGRRHSGIDDTLNILRVLGELIARGYRVHHVSTLKYRSPSTDSFKACRAASQLLEELGECDDHYRSSRRGPHACKADRQQQHSSLKSSHIKK